MLSGRNRWVYNLFHWIDRLVYDIMYNIILHRSFQLTMINLCNNKFVLQLYKCVSNCKEGSNHVIRVRSKWIWACKYFLLFPIHFAGSCWRLRISVYVMVYGRADWCRGCLVLIPSIAQTDRCILLRKYSCRRCRQRGTVTFPRSSLWISKPANL